MNEIGSAWGDFETRRWWIALRWVPASGVNEDESLELRDDLETESSSGTLRAMVANIRDVVRSERGQRSLPIEGAHY